MGPMMCASISWLESRNLQALRALSTLYVATRIHMLLSTDSPSLSLHASLIPLIHQGCWRFYGEFIFRRNFHIDFMLCFLSTSTCLGANSQYFSTHVPAMRLPTQYHHGRNTELRHTWREPLYDVRASPELAISATLVRQGFGHVQVGRLGRRLRTRPACDGARARRKAWKAVFERVLPQATRGDKSTPSWSSASRIVSS